MSTTWTVWSDGREPIATDLSFEAAKELVNRLHDPQGDRYDDNAYAENSDDGSTYPED